MADFTLTQERERVVDDLVQYYVANQGPIKRLLESLHGFISESELLTPYLHSVKRRMKSPKSVKDKLIRKMKKDVEEDKPFHINAQNLFTAITDLGGYRILHLHTRQMEAINTGLVQMLEEAQCTVKEGPRAKVWDRETELYFSKIGILTEYNPRMYSSVHYIVGPHKTKVEVRCEIQVRTLSEEVWGEVDHKFNYPYPIDSVACGEQIKVLARVASSCTRLVDSIFASHADWEKGLQKASPSDRKRVGAIRFDHALPPFSQGWKLSHNSSPSPPTFSAPPEQQEGLAMVASPDQAIDCEVPESYRDCNRLSFRTKLSPGAHFYAKVLLAATDGKGASKHAWLACSSGNSPDQAVSSVEWLIHREPLNDGWILFDLSLPEEIEKSQFGQQEHLKFSAVVAIRLRGNLAVSPIEFLMDK